MQLLPSMSLHAVTGDCDRWELLMKWKQLSGQPEAEENAGTMQPEVEENANLTETTVSTKT